MATNGSVDSGGYQGRTLRFSWSTQSTSGNIRKIAYTVTAVGGSSSVYYHHSEVVKINGTTVYSGAESHAVTTGDVLASGTMDINQSNTTTLTVQMNGGIYSYSDNINTTQSWELDTLIVAPTINSLEVKSKTLNSITCTFTCSKADTFYYKLSTSSTWIRGSSGSITSGTFTISNLSPNTSYTINFIARNWIDESADTFINSTRNISATTYDVGKISSANNFNHGDSTTLVITNPSESSLNLVMKIGNTQILSKTVSAGSNTISFSNTELDNIYKLYGSNNTLTVTFILTTAGAYANSKDVTITLMGNQKTVRNNIGEIWKRGKIFINVNGIWKSALIWLNVNGTWKRGI